VSSTRAADLGA